MTLNITWLLDYSQSSDAVEATSCTLSPNPIASSIPSPATPQWGQTAREWWDHIHTRQHESRTAPLKGCFCGQVRASPGNLPEMHIVWSSLDLLTQKLEMDQPPIPSMAHPPCVLRTQESRLFGLLMLVDHLYTRFLVDLKVDIQTPHGPLCFSRASFLLPVVSALRKCLAFLIC